MTKKNESFKTAVAGLIAEIQDSRLFTREMFGGDFNTEHSKWDEQEVTDFKNNLQSKGWSLMLEEQFGGEGMGDDYYSVYSITDGTNTVYIKLQGWYQSYNGSEYNEWFFVEPKQVLVTQYEKI